MIDVEFCLIFMDDNAQRVPSLVEKVHTAYPSMKISLLNNCSNSDNLSLTFPDYCTVLTNTSENKYTLYSRKLLIDNATSDYIWFVDDDDDVTGADISDIESGADMYEFTYHKVCTYEGQPVDEMESRTNANALWQRFIKTSILKEIASVITEDDKAICAEDTFYTNVAKTYFATDIVSVDKNILIYNVYLSSSGYADYVGHTDKLKKACFGRATIIALRDKYYPNVENDFGGAFYIGKVFSSSGVDNKVEMLGILKDAEFTISEISDFWKTYSINYSKDNWIEGRKAINTVYPDNDDDFNLKIFRWDEKKVISKKNNVLTVSYNERYEDLYDIDE